MRRLLVLIVFCLAAAPVAGQQHVNSFESADCSAETGHADGRLCQEAGTLWVCDTSDVCDSAGEWQLLGQVTLTEEDEFSASMLNPDETHCGLPVWEAINGGADFFITCAKSDSASLEMWFTAPPEWDAGDLVVWFKALNVNASPSGDLQFDWIATCTGDGDVWDGGGTPTSDATTITFDGAQYDMEHSSTVTLSPSSCAAGDLIKVVGEMDNTASTTTQIDDVRVFSGFVRWERTP